MKHTESEINNLKELHSQMWSMVKSQVEKAFFALEKNDKLLAREIITREKMVNTQELVLDHHCENFIALFNPVAIDLRFVISLLKINNNLERIGDFAEGIALFVLHNQSKPIEVELCKKLQLRKMIECAMQMLILCEQSIMEEDSKIAGRVLTLDDIIDDVNRNTIPVLAEYIVANPQSAQEMIYLNNVIRRIERIGDRCSNIAEDVVFYVDAKEVRHRGKTE